MKLLFFLFFLYPAFLFSQIKSGTVTYGISYEFDEDMKSGLMASYVDLAIQNAKYVTFELEFNQEAMRFYPSNSMNVDGMKVDFVLAFAVADGIYYRTKDFSMNYHNTSTRWLGDFIIKCENKLQWELTNEKKYINEFLCFRANATQIVDNGAGVFKFPIIAWYCPEIPFPYGPKSYGGLPGLILELQERDALFGVQTIKLSTTEEKLIEVPTKGKMVTEEEFNTINKEYAKSMED